MAIYVRDKIANNAAKVGKHVLNRLNAEFTELPCVGEATGLGLQIGIEIVADKATKRVFDPSLNVLERIRTQALEKGLFICVSPITTSISDRVDFTTPLIITLEEADRALDILKPILADIKPG